MSITTPFQMGEPTCRGSYLLGSACGKCRRCVEERAKMVEAVKAKAPADTPVEPQAPPTAGEGPAIWDLVRHDAQARYNLTCRHCGTHFCATASATRFCSDICMFMANAAPSQASACWCWRGKEGTYGKVERHKGEQKLAHRFAYELFWGVIEDGKFVRHICDEPSCVNPFHLVAGDAAQNSADMKQGQRQAWGAYHGVAKLTEKQVREIRSDCEATTAELARRYSVSWKSVHNVRVGKTWRLLDEDMKERDRFGREKYGTPLRVGNGRSMLVDAYQEALDLAVYLRGEIEREKAVAGELARLEAELAK